MKKLYAATITIDMYVMAEDDREAEAEARRHLRDESDSADIAVQPVKQGAAVWHHWRGANPYNADDDDDRTVGEIVKAP